MIEIGLSDEDGTTVLPLDKLWFDGSWISDVSNHAGYIEYTTTNNESKIIIDVDDSRNVMMFNKNAVVLFGNNCIMFKDQHLDTTMSVSKNITYGNS